MGTKPEIKDVPLNGNLLLLVKNLNLAFIKIQPFNYTAKSTLTARGQYDQDLLFPRK